MDKHLSFNAISFQIIVNNVYNTRGSLTVPKLGNLSFFNIAIQNFKASLTVIGRSVLLRNVKHGIPKTVVSS